MLKSVETIAYEDIRKSAEFLMPEISVKDSLFDETSLLISMLKDSKESFHELPVDKKMGFSVSKRIVFGFEEIGVHNLCHPYVECCC